jgi:hypothetical protein
VSRHESDDLAGAIRRQVRGLVRRAAAGDTTALEALAGLEDVIPLAVSVAGHVLHHDQAIREADGGKPTRASYSWAEIAQVTGTSRQAAHRRHSSITRDDPLTAWLLQ